MLFYSCYSCYSVSTKTLKYNTIIATLQLVDAVCDKAMLLSDEDIKTLAWSEFVSGLDIKKYKELIRYLKERRLYVDEPVTSDETEE